MFRSLYLLITILSLPLIGCPCQNDSNISDTCSSCHEHQPTTNCSHPCLDLFEAFTKAKQEKFKPSAIIAHTVKGKGISFMEDDNNWHYKTPNKDELELAMQELAK